MWHKSLKSEIGQALVNTKEMTDALADNEIVKPLVDKNK